MKNRCSRKEWKHADDMQMEHQDGPSLLVTLSPLPDPPYGNLGVSPSQRLSLLPLAHILFSECGF